MLTANPTFKVSLGKTTRLIAGGLCLLTLLANNGMYLFICFLTLMLLLGLLWRYNRPGIVVFAFAMQWLQVVAYVLWVNAFGFGIDKFSPSGGTAVILSCIGLLLMAGVMHLVISGLKVPSRELLVAQCSKINDKKLMILYIISTLFFSSAGFVFSVTSAAAQFLITISSLKWVFFMSYVFVVWAKKKNKLLLSIFILYEFTSSLYSYFSSFKEVIFFVIIVALTFVRKITQRQLLYGLGIFAVLLAVMLTWTAIKSDYRHYLNKGKREQVVAVERGEAFDKMQTEVGELSVARYQEAIFMALYRIQYVHNLALAMDRVPTIIDYQNGDVWIQNITFVVAPRFLFPDKGIFSASEKARKFTGVRYAGLKEGASFSLGYFADSYVDFGYVGMFVPLILIALFVGYIYRVFYKMDKMNLMFRYSIINVSLFHFISFENDGLYLFGRLLTTLIVFLILAKTFFPAIQSWLYKQEAG